MKVSGIGIGLLICTALLVSGVSAQTVEHSKIYTVMPAGNHHTFTLTPLVSSSISQGQIVTYSRVISSGTSTMVVDLNWVNTANSLSLTIVAPDETLGPYYDLSDGQTDGRISLSISSSSGLTPGTWKFYVKGDRVSGVQTYNFVTY
jgi:hypothetical protein